MSQKYYIALAETVLEVYRRLQHASNSDTGSVETEVAQSIVLSELVRFCKVAGNGNFKEDRFLDYITARR